MFLNRYCLIYVLDNDDPICEPRKARVAHRRQNSQNENLRDQTFPLRQQDCRRQTSFFGIDLLQLAATESLPTLMGLANGLHVPR